MAIKFSTSSWRFKSPGPIPDSVVTRFFDLIMTIAQQGSFKDVLEDFKWRFSNGKSGPSSNSDWAQTDLSGQMNDAAKNAPRFIAAFADGCTSWAANGKDVPDVDLINEILAEHDAGFQIVDDTLIATSEHLAVPAVKHIAVKSPKKASATPISVPEATPLQAFLCHSSKDKDQVRQLYKRLREDGVKPWLDEEDLVPGQKWEPAIKKAVKESDVVIVFLSATSTSKAGFVHKEIKFALDVADEQPDDKIFIIPARLENCQVPDRLAHLHYVDLFGAKGYDKLIGAITKGGS